MKTARRKKTKSTDNSISFSSMILSDFRQENRLFSCVQFDAVCLVSEYRIVQATKKTQLEWFLFYLRRSLTAILTLTFRLAAISSFFRSTNADLIIFLSPSALSAVVHAHEMHC